MPGTWGQFDPGYPDSSPEGLDVVVTDAPSGARTRNAAELSARIKQSGGALIVNANDSNYIVAANNGTRFTVTRLANGQFRVTESSNYLLFLAVAVVAGIFLLAKR